eukprot:10665120-Ditylum_brightwellii.AAC.1
MSSKSKICQQHLHNLLSVLVAYKAVVETEVSESMFSWKARCDLCMQSLTHSMVNLLWDNMLFP